MSNASEFFDWLDAQEDSTERESEGWICDTIDKAEGAARRLREATDAIREYKAVADRMIADANLWLAEVTAPHASKVESQSKDLEAFLRLQIENGGAKSLPLPYGVSIKATKTGGTFEFAADFAETAPDDVVRKKREVDAAKAKAYYKVTPSGDIIDPNGEIVEGITVKPKVDKYTVTA